MFLPIGDENIKGGAKPIFSYGFIAINVIIFIVQFLTPGNLICEAALIPTNIVKGQDYFTFLTNIFMHGGWGHLLFNMLFLWIFADNIEATIGNFLFVVFYLLGGFFASGLQILFTLEAMNADVANCCIQCVQNCAEDSVFCPGTIPNVGASGAISAVMGAYMVMYPRSKIKILVLIFFRSFHIPALIAIGVWIVMQVFSGINSLSVEAASTGGTAWWAHIGGFVFGALAGFILKIWFKNPDEFS
ncbi:MAG: rhomboid family intramembrane serine protease [Bacteroidota bacterium]